jgi:hypothetical protein
VHASPQEEHDVGMTHLAALTTTGVTMSADKTVIGQSQTNLTMCISLRKVSMSPGLIWLA